MNLLNIIKSEKTKMFSTKSPYITITLMLTIISLLVLVVSYALNNETSVDNSNVVTIFSSIVPELAGMILMIMSILSITSEYNTGTIKTTFQASPKRYNVIIGKAIFYGIFSMIVAEIMLTITLLIAKITEKTYIIDLTSSEVIKAYWAIPLYIFFVVLFGLGIGMILRQTSTAVTISLLWIYVIESILMSIPKLKDTIGNLLPFDNATRFLNNSITESFDQSYHWGTTGSIVYFALFTIIIFIIGIIITIKKDVN